MTVGNLTHILLLLPILIAYLQKSHQKGLKCIIIPLL